MSEYIDITPNPRVLRMLGRIDFKAWQCLAELIDNSIDAFIEHVQDTPRVKITLPKKGSIYDQNSAIELSDNGMGMDEATLQNSIRAGFSGNDPVEKMGLFGMGFNIATARLGGRTEIQTGTKESDEWLVVVIDFKELEASGKFEVPIKSIPKSTGENNRHGTSIRISRLNADKCKPLYRRANILDRLGKIYGRIIRDKNITITIDGQQCRPFSHCTWDRSRSVPHKRFGEVPAVVDINHLVDSRRYCTTCWVWLSENHIDCPSCGESGGLVKRERRIKGWLGIQRYLDNNHYGIDLIRNGRVINELDKTFFYWVDEDEQEELEYPIDGHEKKGRIVGELEIDFVPVTHQKDAFEKDENWRAVLRVIRGEGPIRPDIAKRLGFPEPNSPLAKLFSAYRSVKGEGRKNLVPARPGGGAMITDSILKDMLARFRNGEEDYQSDEKWWDLILKGERPSPRIEQTETDDPAGGEIRVVDDPAIPDDSEMPDDPEAPNDPEVPEDPNRDDSDFDKDNDLSGLYEIPEFPNVRVRVEALRVMKGKNWRGFKAIPKGSMLEFRYWPNSDNFAKNLLMPADFLINELAYQIHLGTMSNANLEVPLSVIELSLREKYFPYLQPTIEEVIRQVDAFVDSTTDALKEYFSSVESFDVQALNSNQQEEVRGLLAQAGCLSEDSIDLAMAKGDFLRLVDGVTVCEIASNYPQALFNGRLFKVDLPSDLNSRVAETLLRDLMSILVDIIWLLRNKRAQDKELWRGRVKRVIGGLTIVQSWMQE